MSDFDPDAYLNESQKGPPQFDPDAYLTQPSKEDISGFKTAPDWLLQSDRPIQGLGTAAIDTAGHIMNAPGKALTGFAVKHGITNPYAAAAIGVLPDLAEDAIGAKVAPSEAGEGTAGLSAEELAKSAQQITQRNVQGRAAGAAAASPNITNSSPGLQAAVSKAAQANAGSINMDALARHVEADSLPVSIQLTRGQATQNPAILSIEQNSRAASPALAARFNEQNQKLVQNLQALRDQVGPDVFSTNPVEHGDTLISAYKAKAATADADISAKYQALKEANGGNFPVDATLLKNNVDQALHDKLLYEHAPSAEMTQLNNAVKSGKLSFEQFEAMRTNLARVMRSSSDGNERAAAGVIRQQMEALPMSGATGLKDLADSARSAARTQFNALDADPAYKAAVNDSVTPDRFVSRFIVNGSRDQVAKMRDNLADNPEALQTMGVASLDHLRQSAGIDSMGNGNFSQAGYNRHLEALGPKMRTIFGPETTDQLQTLGNVARYTQFQPRGSFVNNSNTATAAMGEFAKGALEHAVNAKFAGVPVGTWTRKALQGRAAKAFARDSLEPGAGLGDVE